MVRYQTMFYLVPFEICKKIKMNIKRLQLFEFNDFSWIPASIREVSMGIISEISKFFKIFDQGFTKVEQSMKVASKPVIQGLCAGDGQLMVLLSKFVKSKDIAIVVSDLHPNLSSYNALEKKSNGNIRFLKKPVNVFDVPADQPGTRLIINAIHHFPKEEVKRIISKSVNDNEPLVFLEPISRDIMSIIKYIVAAPFACLIISLLKTFSGRFVYLLWGILIPLGTFIHIFDGIVSHLRAYKPEELREMVQETDTAGKYQWDIGVSKATLDTKMIYLIGYPK